jgi:hypothetical protein
MRRIFLAPEAGPAEVQFRFEDGELESVIRELDAKIRAAGTRTPPCYYCPCDIRYK